VRAISREAFLGAGGESENEPKGGALAPGRSTTPRTRRGKRGEEIY